MISRTINAMKYSMLVLVLLFLFRPDVSNAAVFEDTLGSRDARRTKGLVPRLVTKHETSRPNTIPYDDSKWSNKSRGLGVGESTKKESNKKDSMGKLVKGEEEEEEEEEILPEKPNEKSMQSIKAKKDYGGMNSGKKLKVPSTFPTSAPSVPFGVVTDAPTVAEAPTATPTDHPTSLPSTGFTVETVSPTLSQHIVRLDDYYVSFVAPDATRSPTTEEFSEMLLRITAYFDAYLTEYFATNQGISFDRIETINNFNLYGISEAGQPEERYNIYMNFDYSDFIFTPDTLFTPTAEEIFTILLTSITPDFILNVVRTYTFTPFESTNEVFCGTSIFTDGPP